MCGFVGFTGLREGREAILHKMADRIIHRGPDMEGYHLSGETPADAVALGFRRLSIIDLAAGRQPMYNEDGTVVAASRCITRTAPSSACSTAKFTTLWTCAPS